MDYVTIFFEYGSALFTAELAVVQSLAVTPSFLSLLRALYLRLGKAGRFRLGALLSGL